MRKVQDLDVFKLFHLLVKDLKFISESQNDYLNEKYEILSQMLTKLTKSLE